MIRDRLRVTVKGRVAVRDTARERFGLGLDFWFGVWDWGQVCMSLSLLAAHSCFGVNPMFGSDRTNPNPNPNLRSDPQLNTQLPITTGWELCTGKRKCTKSLTFHPSCHHSK